MQLQYPMFIRCCAMFWIFFVAGGVQAFDLPQMPNMVGVGVGVTTQCTGCKDTIVGVVPAVEYQSEYGQLEWYGPAAQFDMAASDSSFRWGPVIGIRLGRNHLDDPVLDALPSIKTTMEAGGFIGYQYSHPGSVPYRLRLYSYVMTNAGQVYGGTRGSVFGSAWVPVSERSLLGAGGGYSWASKSFMNTYYGVTDAGSAASGLPAFTAHGGSQQVYTWVAAVMRFSPQWFGGVGVINQHLIGSAADTPIVTQRGQQNQVTYGAGLGYAW